MCDSIDDEINSMIERTQTVFRDIVFLNQDPDKTKIESYCKCNQRIIQFIVHCTTSEEHRAKKEEFRSMINAYIETE